MVVANISFSLKMPPAGVLSANALFSTLILTLMGSDWPSGLDQFGEFLRAQGLSFERRGIVQQTGDKVWQFGTSKIGVGVFADAVSSGAFNLRTLQAGPGSGIQLPR